ncbi:MAG: ATP synthase F1 subunit gamma [Candidatus Sericytochromatia bacterium]|nr:ATP synthase F1 subunit gamma [Candidatus Sericytochromatia bacterium]
MGGNAREIRARIKSVKNTEKITRAMQMVAAAKVRRARERVEAAQPYAIAMDQVFRQVASQVPPSEYRSPLLEKRRIRKVALIVITSDRGLCGGYNANVLRMAMNRYRFWLDEHDEAKLIVVGTKGVQFFKDEQFDVVARLQNLPAIPTPHEAARIVKLATDLYASGQADLVELIHTNFRSMVSLVPTDTVLLPASVPGREQDPHSLDAYVPDGPPQAQYLYEPSPDVVLDAMVPKYLETLVYQALLESAASELAAKMTAMSAASKNAKELAAELTLVYNKARQASITQEILEVVGGAAAL